MKNNFDTIKISSSQNILRVTLNRAEVRNAFNEVMIRELTDCFDGIRKQPDKVRVIVLTGEGVSFCAGADLHWMKSLVNFTYEENLQDSLRLAEMFQTIASCPLPIVARVNGPAIGGGAGLVATSDIVIASETATIALTEVKLGLVPAVISPYLLRRIGDKNCREYFLTGEKISARRACEIGLVNYFVPESELDKCVEGIVIKLLSSGPMAMAACKEMLSRNSMVDQEKSNQFWAELIARLRVSDEAQEGMKAFLEKRSPDWLKK